MTVDRYSSKCDCLLNKIDWLQTTCAAVSVSLNIILVPVLPSQFFFRQQLDFHRQLWGADKDRPAVAAINSSLDDVWSKPMGFSQERLTWTPTRLILSRKKIQLLLNVKASSEYFTFFEFFKGFVVPCYLYLKDCKNTSVKNNGYMVSNVPPPIIKHFISNKSKKIRCSNNSKLQNEGERKQGEAPWSDKHETTSWNHETFTINDSHTLHIQPGKRNLSTNRSVNAQR